MVLLRQCLFVLLGTGTCSRSPLELEIFNNVFEEANFALDHIEAMLAENTEEGLMIRSVPELKKIERLIQERPKADQLPFSLIAPRLCDTILELVLYLPKQPERLRFERDHLLDLYYSLMKILQRTDQEQFERKTPEQVHQISLFAMMIPTIDRTYNFLKELWRVDPHPSAKESIEEVQVLLARLRSPGSDLLQKLKASGPDSPVEWPTQQLRKIASKLARVRSGLKEIAEIVAEHDANRACMFWATNLEVLIPIYEEFQSYVEEILGPRFPSPDEFLSEWRKLYVEFPDLAPPPTHI
jgi:hypothetical protein